MWRSYGGGIGAGMGIPLVSVGLGPAVVVDVLRWQVEHRGSEPRERHAADATERLAVLAGSP